MTAVCRVRISGIPARGRIRVAGAEKKRAARSATGICSRTKSIPNIITRVRISPLAKIELVIPRECPHARVLEIDDLPSSRHAGYHGDET